jgi:hypothetical protein
MKTKLTAIAIMALLITSLGAHSVDTGVVLTLDAAGFSGVHFLADTYQFEVYNTLGKTLTGKLSSDAQFQVNLNQPGVQYWPYSQVQLSAADGSPDTVVNNWVNAGSSNFSLEIYSPDGHAYSVPVTATGQGFQPLGTFASLGITQPGDYYLKLTWQQQPATPVTVSAPYSVWEGTLLDELKLVGVSKGQRDQVQTWLATHPPMP